MSTELTTPIKIEIPGIGTIESADLYLKSEADKVIAEQKEKLVEQVTLRTWAELQLRHQKYKRCLDKAKWCEERYRYLTCLENWQLTDKEYQQVIGGYWDRWHERWLELAEKFKVAK